MYGNAAGDVSLTTECRRRHVCRIPRGGRHLRSTRSGQTGGNTDRLDYGERVGHEIDGYRAQSRAVNRRPPAVSTWTSAGPQLAHGRQPDRSAAIRRRRRHDARASQPRAAFRTTSRSCGRTSTAAARFVYTAPAGEHGSIKARNYYAWRDFGNLLPVQNAGIVDLQRAFVGGGFSYNYDGFWLDTSKSGNHNTGHAFAADAATWSKHLQDPKANPLPSGVIGPEFTDDERYAIIEYLKVHRDLPQTPADYQPPQCQLRGKVL
jgi:hypothetical protein